jgi:hypothetical protein
VVRKLDSINVGKSRRTCPALLVHPLADLERKQLGKRNARLPAALAADTAPRATKLPKVQGRNVHSELTEARDAVKMRKVKR